MIIINRVIKKYYRKTLEYSAIRYIAEYITLITLFKLIFVFIGLTIGEFISDDYSELQLEKKYEHQESNSTELLIISVLIAPFIETILYHWIPIYLLKKITNNYFIVILLTGVLFASAHLSYDILYAFSMFPYGIIFSWIFYCKYKKSVWSALLYTTAIHSGVNLISVLFITAGR